MSDMNRPRFLPSPNRPDDLMFVSGQIPRVDGELLAKGRLGEVSPWRLVVNVRVSALATCLT